VAAEFFVDGRSLLEHCERAAKQTFDLVSPFGWTPAEYRLEVAQRLLLRRPAVLTTGRREFLVCPECADLACGCISAIVERAEGCYFWSNFGYEASGDPVSLQLFPMGRIVVREDELFRLLSRIVPRLTDAQR
jgi:hypothetical protein